MPPAGEPAIRGRGYGLEQLSVVLVAFGNFGG